MRINDDRQGKITADTKKSRLGERLGLWGVEDLRTKRGGHVLKEPLGLPSSARSPKRFTASLRKDETAKTVRPMGVPDGARQREDGVAPKRSAGVRNAGARSAGGETNKKGPATVRTAQSVCTGGFRRLNRRVFF